MINLLSRKKILKILLILIMPFLQACNKKEEIGGAVTTIKKKHQVFQVILFHYIRQPRRFKIDRQSQFFIRGQEQVQEFMVPVEMVIIMFGLIVITKLLLIVYFGQVKVDLQMLKL